MCPILRDYGDTALWMLLIEKVSQKVKNRQINY